MKPFHSPDPLLSAHDRHRTELRRPECKCARPDGVSYHGIINLDGFRSHHHATCKSCGRAIYAPRGLAENLTRDVADVLPIRHLPNPVTDTEPPEAA